MPQPVRVHPQAMTDHSVATMRDEGVVLIQISRPEVRKTVDEHTHAFKGR